jgi:hypothetical protein
VFTQGSLILGLIAFVIDRPALVKRPDAFLLAFLTILLLSIGMALVRDAEFSRRDGAYLPLGGWSRLHSPGVSTSWTPRPRSPLARRAAPYVTRALLFSRWRL